MARYDRIATLPAPARSETFPAWPVLRDLDGRERDPELGRRVRLRFLALRPVARILARGLDAIPAASLDRQVEGVREELGSLPPRDVERARLADYLHALAGGGPVTIAAATLEMGEVIEEAGHRHGAEEYYRTAVELAAAHDLASARAGALRLLARLEARARRWDEAEDLYRAASELALRAGDRRTWAEAMGGLGEAFRGRGRPAEAAALFQEVIRRGRSWSDDAVVAFGSAALAAHELAAGDAEAALEHGWTALSLLEEGRQRLEILQTLAAALERLGLYRAAERCHEIVARRATGDARFRALAAHAALAGFAGDASAFRRRRKALLREIAGAGPDPRTRAHVHLRLARGALRADAPDFTRDHLRTALAAAKEHDLPEILTAAEELLGELEQAAREAGAALPAPAGPAARRIAAEIESLAAEAPAGGS